MPAPGFLSNNCHTFTTNLPDRLTYCGFKNTIYIKKYIIKFKNFKHQFEASKIIVMR